MVSHKLPYSAVFLVAFLPTTATLGLPSPPPPPSSALRAALAATKAAPPATSIALWQEALSPSNRAEMPLPVQAAAYNTLGELLGRCGRDVESIQALDQALALDPQAATIHASRGHALGRLFRYRAAASSHT